jgi:hypothetical protein
MRLLASGFTTAETTIAGTTAGGGEVFGAAAQIGKSMTIRKVTAFGASSVAENTSGGMKLVTGNSSDSPVSTFVILPGPTSGGISVTLDGLSIECSWFDVFTNEAGAGGYGVYVFGD